MFLDGRHEIEGQLRRGVGDPPARTIPLDACSTEHDFSTPREAPHHQDATRFALDAEWHPIDVQDGRAHFRRLPVGGFGKHRKVQPTTVLVVRELTRVTHT
jgi:hypothetical protein